jgi:predicted lactoylglutathione lyase
MIGYITLGTNDIDKACDFYDSLLEQFDATRVMQSDRMVAWATPTGQPMLSVIIPFDLNEATPGNGTMVALSADTQDLVQKIHTRAMQLGAADEGEPGPRGDGGFYGAYFRDLDGNKLAVFCMAG